MPLLGHILNVLYTIQLIFRVNIVQEKVFMLKVGLYLTARRKRLLKEMIFRQNSYSIFDQLGRCHQLADSSLARLAVNLTKDFYLDYMRRVCLGVVRRMLHYFKGCFKCINSGKL